MKLPTTLLLTYQAEYERTPNMTISELCTKYDVQTKQLKGYTKWQKKIENTTEPAEAEDDIISQPIASTAQHSELATPKTSEDVQLEIDEFKRLAVAHATKFMREDVEFAEVKEFKDIVAIVDSIEKSYKDTKDPQGTTINIAIQNLVEKFSDDC